MGLRHHQVIDRMADMEKLAKGIVANAEAIKKIQSECQHCFRFGFQANAFHERLWHVLYQCDECGAEKQETKKPVCEIHDLALVRCGPDDTEAETERIKPEHKGHWNAARAYRCPRIDCRKIHILWLNGD